MDSKVVKEWSASPSETKPTTVYCGTSCKPPSEGDAPKDEKAAAAVDQAKQAIAVPPVACEQLFVARPAPGPPIADVAFLSPAPPATAFERDFAEATRPFQTVGVRIATVTDPIDSGLPYYFDSHIEALQLAFERDGYSRDQSWLPWADTVSGDDKVRQASEACRREMPGVIIFRRNTDAPLPPGVDLPATMLALVVGETPTTGVQKAAFSRAIDIHRRLAGPKPLRVIGPTFSGSAESLRETIDREWECSARVVSGTATSRAAARTMRTPPNLPKRAAQVQFELTTIAEDELQCAYFRQLWNTQEWWREQPRGPQGAQVLKGLALLRESGTAFGELDVRSDEGPRGKKRADNIAGRFRCMFEPDLDLRFPLHISSVRDAYESSGDARSRRARPDGIRRTALDVVLAERTKARDTHSDASTKSPIARDLVLTQLLAAVARQNIRYVAIQATDSADVIFLAQKIRNVTPDVRLAIFGSDVLYTHPDFREDLLGSHVITAYPFFGGNDFTPLTPQVKDRLLRIGQPLPRQDHIPFESASSEGIYNAALAVSRRQNGGTEDLAEYDFFERRLETADVPPPLPIWISAIGSSGLSPIVVRRPPNCGELIYGRENNSLENELCQKKHEDNDSIERRKTLRLTPFYLPVDADISPPNFWQFVLAAVMLAALLDFFHGRAIRRPLRPFRQMLMRRDLDDREIDLLLVSAKHSFYLALRRQILGSAFIAMVIIQSLAVATYGNQLIARQFPIFLLIVGTLGSLAIAAGLYSGWRRFFRWRRLLRKVLKSRQPVRSRAGVASAVPRGLRTLWDKVSERIGFDTPACAGGVVSHTLRQLRFLAVTTAIVVLPLSFLFIKEIEELDPMPGSIFLVNRATNPGVAMFVLRALPLVNRLSPAAPILVSLGCIYLWAFGRSKRLRLLGMVAEMTPASGAADGTCTPITTILHGVDYAGDAFALRNAERGLRDAILTPSQSPPFFFVMLAATALPIIAFILKSPTTLESWELTIVLVALLATCSVLIIGTVVQLALYWQAFSRLLGRIQTHPIAESFDDIPGPLKETVDSQVSRSRDDSQRLAACVRRLEELVATWPSVARSLPRTFHGSDLDDRLAAIKVALGEMYEARTRALDLSEEGRGAPLARLLVEAAAAVRVSLAEVWAGHWRTGKIGPIRPASEDGARNPDERVDAMTRFDGDESLVDAVRWLRRAHSFVAAVVTVILNRHVRQFRIFLYSATGSALVLLAALTSYVFQPKRLMLTCIWIVMGLVVGTCVYVFVELDRNPVLSRASGTQPGQLEVNASFFARIMGWAGVPLLSVAAAQYPDVASGLFSWMEPFINALK